jgi:MaoC dehydratase-like protein
MAEIDRSLIGVWGQPSTMRVELGKIREFAKAVKDPNPAYRDEANWIGDLGATRSAVKLDYRRLLHGEQEFEYVAPIRPGDTLTFRSRTKDVFEKAGKRGGTMLFVIGETEFTNQRGEVVAYMRNTAIETSGVVKE